MKKACEVSAGRAVPKRQLRFTDTKPGAGRVDSHAHLAAEPGRHREARRPRSRRERPLAGERLARLEAGECSDETSCDALGEAEATADSLGERGDVEVDALFQQRRQLTRQIGVAEQRPPEIGAPKLRLGKIKAAQIEPSQSCPR